jgi:hypothetical protein
MVLILGLVVAKGCLIRGSRTKRHAACIQVSPCSSFLEQNKTLTPTIHTRQTRTRGLHASQNKSVFPLPPKTVSAYHAPDQYYATIATLPTNDRDKFDLNKSRYSRCSFLSVSDVTSLSGLHRQIPGPKRNTILMIRKKQT